MRASLRRAGTSLFVAVSLSLAGSAARAEELLVMPYACSIIGGRPLLTQAPEQSHRILGQREQRTFTSCSPVNPDLCRSWIVHRFDIDCEGARVPWTSLVVSVEEETTRRAWIEGGRLVVRMPPSWSFEPGDPCARRSRSYDDGFDFGRMRRYCAERRAMAPPPVVEMPFGFAPMLGIDGIFVKSSSPSTKPAPPSVAAAPPAMPPKVTRAEPSRPEAPPPSATRPESPDPVKQTPTPDAKPPKSASSASPHIPAEPPAPTAKTTPPATAPGGPVIPKIINRPEAAASAEKSRPVTTGSNPSTPKVPTASPGPTPRSADTREKDAAPKPDHDPGNAPITVSLGLSSMRNPVTGIIVGVLALALLGAFALARRRERLAGGRPPHDLASVSLGDRRGHRQLVPSSGAASRRPAAAQPSPPSPAAQSPTPGRTPAWVDRIPQTRSEALQMLGIGVSPEATEVAMKKIVDGLRLSWHPDLAKDEADRQMREFRVKQINAAWELIQGKRLERLDS